MAGEVPNESARPPYFPERGPLRVVIEQPRRSILGAILKWGFLVLVFLFVLGWINASSFYEGDASSISERWHSLSKLPGADKVAIITVDGVILDAEGFVKAQIDRVRDDKRVKAVVLRVNSPGGTVTASDYIYHHLKKLIEDRKLPMVVSMGGLAASGGYYIAMAAGDHENRIFAEPATWTGSIGVVIPHYDVTGLMEKLAIADDSIPSHPLKLMGSPTATLPEPVKAEEREILQGLVNDSFDDFKSIVLASRKQLRDNPEIQASAFTGQIFTARQALAKHLVDKIGYIEDAIDRAIELAQLDKDEVSAVRYHRPTGLLDQLLFGPQAKRPSLDLSALRSLSEPRAYYLFTLLPGFEALAQ